MNSKTGNQGMYPHQVDAGEENSTAQVQGTPPYQPQWPGPPAGGSKRISTKALILIIAQVVVVVVVVLIVLSLLAPSGVTVPKLMGLDVERAKELLEELGLRMEPRAVSISGYREGEVISQTPGPGEKLGKGETVQVDYIQKTTTGEDTGKDDGGRISVDLSGMASLTASSIMAPDAPWVNYLPANLIDNDYATCWAEGRQGYGIGEWVRFTFADEVEVNKLTCVPGLLKMDDGKDRWLQNGRLKTVEILFDGGVRITHSFEDRKAQQEVNLDVPVKTHSVTVIIKEVYPGQSGPNWKLAEDTSVSELHVWGRKI